MAGRGEGKAKDEVVLVVVLDGSIVRRGILLLLLRISREISTTRRVRLERMLDINKTEIDSYLVLVVITATNKACGSHRAIRVVRMLVDEAVSDSVIEVVKLASWEATMRRVLECLILDSDYVCTKWTVEAVILFICKP